MFIAVVFCSCSKLDNFSGPNGGIYGKLTDQTTDEGLRTDYSGYTIRLYEMGAYLKYANSKTNPVSFGSKPDGTYENTMLFQNKYKMIVSDGAFFPLDTVVIDIGARTEKNFTVEPYLTVTDVTVTPAAGKITASYKIAQSTASTKILWRKTLVSEVAYVSNAVYRLKTETNLSEIPDADVLSGAYTDEVLETATYKLVSGTTYYVKVAVRTSNLAAMYNYSKTFEVKIP